MSKQDSASTQKDKAQKTYDLLKAHYGIPEWRVPLPPVDELISTILSQNTNDLNRDKAFNRLKEKFESWEDVRDAPEKEVIEAIRTAGLANQKGPRIQEALREITRERGKIELDFLRKRDREETRQWLKNLKGVGPKTAAIVMQFSLGMPAFPVDTHILRVSKRVGLVSEKMNAERAHAHLESLFRENQYGPGHLNLIRLGREICHPRNPECEICPLNAICDYYRNNK